MLNKILFRDEDLTKYFKSDIIKRKKCLCCNSHNYKIWTSIFHNKINFLACRNCNFIWGFPICNNKMLSRYYDDYITRRRLNVSKKMKLRDFQYDQDIAFITKSIQKGNLLDVGCNGGFFLKKFPSKFTKFGIDIDKKAILYGKKKFKFGKNMKAGSFLKEKYKNNFFDIVVLRGTIEHLLEPEKFIKKISQILKKNGKLYILATPNGSSISAKLFKEDWTLFHPVQHISHFNKKNISIMAKRNNLNLKRVEYPYMGTPYENLIFDIFNFFKYYFKKLFKKNKNIILNSPPFFGNMMSLEFQKENINSN